MEDLEPGTPGRRDSDTCSGAPEISYRCLFELAPEPVLILSLEGHVVASNQMARDLFGLRRDDTHAHIVEKGLPGLGAGAGITTGEMMSQLFCDVQDAGNAHWQFEVPGTDRTMEARLSCLTDEVLPDGGFLWTAHDVTERVRLERTRQELVNMLVHDLRVPLGNVQISLDMVLAAVQERDVTLPIEQVLQVGLRSAHRMERLVSDILDTARLQARERTLNVAPIVVAALVAEAAESIEVQAEHRNQALHIHIKPNLPLMEGDFDLLRRVLVNLLNNAVKFTQDGGKIAVEADLVTQPTELAAGESDKFRFKVIDNGLGISPQVQERLFELFYRGEATQIKGAGIGLAFCKLAVEAHGGRIWVESTLGAGSTFTFTIPRKLPKSTPYYQEVES